MDPNVEEGDDFVELEDKENEEPMDSDGDDYEETEEERQMQFEELDENATMIFDRHTKSVFCSKPSPDGDLLASGGEDDRGFIFDRDGELYMALFGHKDSVVSVDWNKDGTLLASADMAGLIKIWNIKEKKAIMDLEEDELEFVSFHPALDKKGHSYLLAAQTDGNCYFYSLKDASFQLLAGPAGIKCLTSHYLNSGRNVLILYEDASLRIFDLKTCECKSSLSIQNRIQEAICCDMSNDGKTVLVGSSTGQICVLNIDESLNIKLIDRIETNDEKEYKNDDNTIEHPIEKIQMWNTIGKGFDNMFVAASLGGILYVYEKTNQLRLKLVHPDGVNNVIFMPGDVPRVMTAGLDGKLRVWDCRSGEPLLELSGHQDTILDLQIKGMNVTSASDDHTVRYWDLNELQENKN